MAFWSSYFHRSDADDSLARTLRGIRENVVAMQVVLGMKLRKTVWFMTTQSMYPFTTPTERHPTEVSILLYFFLVELSSNRTTEINEH